MNNKQLQLVREKEITVKHTLSQKLAKAAALAHGEQQQLEQLEAYQGDYLQLIQAEQTSWDAAKSQHYRDFCYQLNTIIDSQQQKLEKSKLDIKEIKQAIEQQQHKINVIDEMIEKQSLEMLTIENKRSQQESDMLVARRYY